MMNRASRKACACGWGWRDASLSCASARGADSAPGRGGGPLRLPRPQTNPACAAPQTSASWGCFPNKWKNNVLEPRVKLNYLRKTLWTNTEGRGKPPDQSSSPGARRDEGGTWAGGRQPGHVRHQMPNGRLPAVHPGPGRLHRCHGDGHVEHPGPIRQPGHRRVPVRRALAQLRAAELGLHRVPALPHHPGPAR